MWEDTVINYLGEEEPKRKPRRPIIIQGDHEPEPRPLTCPADFGEVLVKKGRYYFCKTCGYSTK